jgi:hypothetical protein
MNLIEQITEKMQDLSLNQQQQVLNFVNSLQTKEPPEMEFAGIFKDDPDFQEITNNLRQERESELITSN